jgi:FMN phosphatase YigB (HAD superfamily)
MQTENKRASGGRTIRCILFDLGQTLWERVEEDSILQQPATQRAIQVIRKHIAPEIFAQADLPLLNERLYQSVLLQAREFVRSHPDYEPDYGQTVNEALLLFGLPELDRSASEAVFEALRIPIVGSRRLFDDALSTLHTLKQRGFLLGVVTNRYWGGRPFLADVQKLGLFEYFEPNTMAISADLGIRKPNPDIFLHALRELNATPQESAMIGDSLYADIMGAKELDMFTVWKPKRYQHPELKAPQSAVSSNDDGDSLFSHTRERDYQEYWRTSSVSKPDRIIKHLHELLDIFVEVGRQVEIQ